MTDFTPQNPPRDLKRYACPNCRVPLDRIQKEGCKSQYAYKRPACNAESWGSLCKQTEEVR